jgi:hypothetical protein
MEIAILKMRNPRAFKDVYSVLCLGYAVAKGRARVTHLPFKV